MRKRWSIAVVLALVVLAVDTFSGGARAEGTPIVCLDPGHGGNEPGAVNGNLEEKDINLDVAYAVRSQLIAHGYGVVMTRTGDETRSSNDRYTFCNDQQATILVSIHTNSSSNSSADGTLAIYFHNDDKALAAVIQDAVFDTLLTNAPEPEAFVDRGLKRDALGVLLKSNMPAATIEPLFMSHTGEAAALAQPIHQVDPATGVVALTGSEPTPGTGCGDGCRRLEIAQGIAAGIEAYLTTPQPPSDGGGGGGKGGCGSPPCGKR